jgi:signal transduction histidine kinase
MGKTAQNTEIVVLKHVWTAVAFIAVWLWFPHTRHTIGLPHAYGLLALIILISVYRTKVALKHPNAVILRFMPVTDSVIIALLIHFTGGIDSDLWLFYYFQLIAGAMDTKPGSIEIIAPVVILSYIAATMPDLMHWKMGAWGIVDIIGTRLFFLFLTALLARHIAHARNQLSEELSQLSEQLSLSQERNRISREIHDGIGHSLVNCILTLELCERLVCKKPDEACKIIEQEKDDLRAALENMREYVHHLRPAEIENEEFTSLFKKHLVRFRERTGLDIKIKVKNKDVDLPPSSRLVLLRIIQEALTNAAKHSDADQIEVSLEKAEKSGAKCVISDNGRGFDAEEVLEDLSSRQGFGLRTMKDRAASAGGSAEIASEPGKGTKVTVCIPG